MSIHYLGRQWPGGQETEKILDKNVQLPSLHPTCPALGSLLRMKQNSQVDPRSMHLNLNG